MVPVPAKEVVTWVYSNMLMKKVSLMKHAIITKPKIRSVSHSISVALALHLENAMLLKIIQSGKLVNMVSEDSSSWQQE